MIPLKATAPAKVNLTLHITGLRDDGYHLLDSLVVFAGVCDTITAAAADGLTLKVSGPFAQGVPSDGRNLILAAAQTLRRVRGVTAGAEIMLEKQLPHAAGIGSGSSDAATALTVLAKLWDVDPLPGDAPQVALLGADVPVCLHAPAPVRMAGIGDQITAIPALPDCAMVLVNPRVEVPTAAVFKALTTKENAPMDALPEGLDYDGFTQWLKAQRNDLQAPAETIAPEVTKAIKRLGQIPAVGWAGMSGSGATCVALVRDMAAARQVARTMQLAEMGWWVTPAEMLKPGV